MGISENAHQAIRFFSLEQILPDQSKSHVFYLFCGLHQVKRLEALHAGAHSTCSHAADFFRAVSHACGSAINIFHYRASFHYPDIHSMESMTYMPLTTLVIRLRLPCARVFSIALPAHEFVSAVANRLQGQHGAKHDALLRRGA